MKSLFVELIIFFWKTAFLFIGKCHVFLICYKRTRFHPPDIITFNLRHLVLVMSLSDEHKKNINSLKLSSCSVLWTTNQENIIKRRNLSSSIIQSLDSHIGKCFLFIYYFLSLTAKGLLNVIMQEFWEHLVPD